jgi:hypothetical protein
MEVRVVDHALAAGPICQTGAVAHLKRIKIWLQREDSAVPSSVFDAIETNLPG